MLSRRGLAASVKEASASGIPEHVAALFSKAMFTPSYCGLELRGKYITEYKLQFVLCDCSHLRLKMGSPY